MYKRVLVPVDGSEVAEAVLPFIEQIAGPLDLEVVLLNVVQPIGAIASPETPYVAMDDLAARREDARAYLAGLAGELRAKGIRVEKIDRCGDPVEQILDAARASGVDLIAMTTHGRTGPARLLFGSVAEGVLRHSDIPVFLMRQTEKDIVRRRRKEALR
jgi:nucleotide-binding universal stress UspA family protein